MESLLHFSGNLQELLKDVCEKFPAIEWSIHESEAYYTGSYILGRTNSQKITIEVKEEGASYEVAIS